MIDKELIEKIRSLKIRNGYTLYELSKRIDIQVGTLERWFKTGRINKLYAKIVKERLGI
jgi:transcriptional regulator with XRE-family HTH domain